MISFIIKRSDSIVCDAEVVRKKIIEIDSNLGYRMNREIFKYQREFSIKKLIIILKKYSHDIFLKRFYFKADLMKLYFC